MAYRGHWRMWYRFRSRAGLRAFWRELDKLYLERGDEEGS